jgi:hypothetical protein
LGQKHRTSQQLPVSKSLAQQVIPNESETDPSPQRTPQTPHSLTQMISPITDMLAYQII